MSEENVTKSIIKFLISNSWQIVSYDFPQSGTGKVIHPDESTEKLAGAIIPDIVSVKDGICLFFENKSFYYRNDFIKQSNIKTSNIYNKGICDLLRGYTINTIFYGIGYPYKCFEETEEVYASMVDFIVGVTEDRKVYFLKNFK